VYWEGKLKMLNKTIAYVLVDIVLVEFLTFGYEGMGQEFTGM